MSRSRGRRYDKEPKLNIKKVIAVILAIVVIVMFVIIIKNIVTSDGDNARISSLSYFVSFENDKWGVIDSNGNNVINPSYEEMIIIPNSKKSSPNVNFITGNSIIIVPIKPKIAVFFGLLKNSFNIKPPFIVYYFFIFFKFCSIFSMIA